MILCRVFLYLSDFFSIFRQLNTLWEGMWTWYLYNNCMDFVYPFFFASLKLENKFYLDKRTTTLIPKRFHLKKKSEQCFYFYISARSWSVLSRCGVTALPGGIPHPHPVSTCCVCWWLQLIKWFMSKYFTSSKSRLFLVLTTRKIPFTKMYILRCFGVKRLINMEWYKYTNSWMRNLPSYCKRIPVKENLPILSLEWSVFQKKIIKKWLCNGCLNILVNTSLKFVPFSFHTNIKMQSSCKHLYTSTYHVLQCVIMQWLNSKGEVISPKQ